LLKEGTIVALHNLEAAAEVVCHPAAVIAKAIWSEAASIAEAPVNRDRVAAVEVLDDHVEHVSWRLAAVVLVWFVMRVAA
jgi:hypothetical protein